MQIEGGLVGFAGFKADKLKNLGLQKMCFKF